MSCCLLQHELDRRLDGRNGRTNGLQAASYPGSFRRRRGSWWQRVIQFLSPPALEPVPSSPGVSPPHDDSSSSQSSTHTVRSLQRQHSDMDADMSLDEVDAQAEPEVLFHIGEEDPGTSDDEQTPESDR